MRILTINNNQFYKADEIIKDGNDVKLINAREITDEGLVPMGDILFPMFKAEYVIADGRDWDIPMAHVKMMYDLDMDYRLSVMEMGL